MMEESAEEMDRLMGAGARQIRTVLIWLRSFFVVVSPADLADTDIGQFCAAGCRRA